MPSRLVRTGESYAIDRAFSGIQYYKKLMSLGTSPPIAYWPLWDAGGAVADNAMGDAGFDAAYDVDCVLGEPGIGDGRTSIRNDGNAFVNLFTVSLRDAFNSREGTLAVMCKVGEPWSETTARVAIALGASDADRIYIRKSTAAIIHALAKFNNIAKQWQSGGQSTLDFFHLALTWSLSNDELIFYIDGNSEGTYNSIGDWNPANLLASNRCYIGGYIGGNTPWHGWQAHGAVWDYAQEPDAITEMANI